MDIVLNYIFVWQYFCYIANVLARMLLCLKFLSVLSNHDGEKTAPQAEDPNRSRRSDYTLTGPEFHCSKWGDLLSLQGPT